MDEFQSKLDSDRQLLTSAAEKGAGSKLATYLKLSGPGWLQSAITLGGGSLASSLFLGILGGFSLLWIQPVAMILGIIMLGAIGYVTLATQERPFQAIRDHVNPALAWGWALAVAAANIVWCLPQYSLANGVLSQNLLPGILGPEGIISSFGGEVYGSTVSKVVVSISLLLICTLITWSYDRGGWGIKLYETVLKCMVALIVLCFFGVVAVLSAKGAIPWSDVFHGLLPKFGQFSRPAATFEPLLQELTDSSREYWSNYIVSKQQDILFSAAATAVGINMTFLFPYSLLRKGWTKEFQGLTIFDLCTGMFIPYVLATGCVVVAAAAQFHTKVTPDFTVTEDNVTPPEDFENAYYGLVKSRMLSTYTEEDRALFEKMVRETPANARPIVERDRIDGFLESVALEEKKLVAALVDRRARHLSGALAPLTGKFVADIIFGLGVLAMALSTISLLMLISGFVFCELLGLEQGGWPHRFGTLIAGVVGATGPFVWSGASFYLAVPTSVFGLALLPFAYITFVLLMNQRSLLGDNMPRGTRRLTWNLLMVVAASVSTAASLYVVYTKTHAYLGSGWYGLVGVAILIALLVVSHLTKNTR